VPKGKSWLGGGSGVVGEHGVEPVHEVEIVQDFYLGKYEVTQEEWQKVMGRNPSSFVRNGAGKDSVKDVADADLARFPVENVSWDDCQEFITRVNERTKESGWVYRLPKQSEWEYACRGGPLADRLESTFDFYSEKPTNQLRPDQANIVGKGRTCKVGSYKPNRLGLYDMHGNVWEWCEDIFDAKDPALASLRAIRGGCWVDGPENCRAAVRHATAPSLRSHYFGLRLARVPSGAPSPINVAKGDGNLDPERKAAEWVLSVDGTIQVNGVNRFLKGATELPAEPIRLTYVNFHRHEIGNESDLTFFKPCKSLLILHLEFTKVSDAGLANFKNCKSLLSLNLGGEQVGNAGLANFKDCNLAQLRLYRTRVNDDGLSDFKDSKNLTKLALNGMPLTDAGLAHFKGCKKLTNVDLANTQVSDKALAQFKECKDLVELLLKGTKVSAAGIDELRTALPQCRIEWDGGVIEPIGS
jgi:eukaryotic-like serine/threonine-protein kinase